MNEEALKQHRRYEDARSRIWPEKRVNIAMETIRKSSQIRQEKIREWTMEAARAIGAVKLKDALSSGFGTHGVAHVQEFAFIAPNHDVFQRKTMREITMEVLKSHKKITFDDVKGKARSYPIVKARHHVFWEIRRQRPDLILADIGQYFGTDHSVILYGSKRHAERMGKENGQAQDSRSI